MAAPNNLLVKLAETNEELEQILILQNANYFGNLSVEDRNTNGFVTVKHDIELLKKMNIAAQQVVAVENEKVVAYALVMLREFAGVIPVLVPMFDMFEKLSFKGNPLNSYNYYVMGQICIADGYRGKGIFEMLYKKHREVYSKQFAFCLTEVSVSKGRSMKAHERVGFKTIYTFQDQTDTWNILLWEY